jgi:peptidoglycan/LPS O-acetylase OafA/YrhL
VTTALREPETTPVTPPEPRRLAYEPGLDGLRGLAVAGVLLFHGGVTWATGGFLGVSTFFTLSGFLITTLLLHQHEGQGRIGLRSFWSRRFRRLMPAALFALLLCVLYVALAGQFFQYDRLRGDVLSALFYVENWRLVFTGQSYLSLFSAPSPVQHFWSLAIEEQFYLLFPLLAFGLLAFGKGSRRFFTIALAVLAVVSFALMFVVYHPGDDPSRAYYGTDTRAVELLVGALLAVVFTGGGRARLARAKSVRIAVAVLGVLALIATLVVWKVATDSDTWLYRGGLTAYALGSICLILAAISPGPVRWLLSLAPIRYLGKISYGVYLYHWPVYLYMDNSRTGLDGSALMLARIVVTVAIAAVSYRYLEMPIRTGRRLTDWRPWLVAPVAAVALVVALFVVTASPPPAVELAAAAADNSKPPTLPKGATPTYPSRVMVVGDSVAQTLGRGLERWGQEHDVAVWNRAHRLCGVINAGVFQVLGTLKGCNQWPQWKSDVKRFDPQVVVVLSTFWDLAPRRWHKGEKFVSPRDPAFDRRFVDTYARFVDVLSARGATVLVIPPPCLEDVGLSGLLEYERTTLLPQVVAARPDTLGHVDVMDRLCPGGKFKATLGGISDARPDGTHFTDKSADWAAKWLMPRIEETARARRAAAPTG